MGMRHRTQISKPPVSFLFVQSKKADRTYYIRDKIKKAKDFLTYLSTELSHSLFTTFSFDQFSFEDFKKYCWPAITSGAALLAGELVTREGGAILELSEEYKIAFKFLMGATILGYAALHRTSEQQPSSIAQLSSTVASEILGIVSLYTSVYQSSRLLTSTFLSENASLITSLGISSLAIPSAVSFLAQKTQEQLVKKQYAQGAQRSDTALTPAGLTAVSNSFFQVNHFLLSEILTLSRIFQLGLISHNIFYAPHPLNKFRNFPALMTDIAPPIVKNLITQQKKINDDRHYQTTKEQILKFTSRGFELITKQRYQLRNGDLVVCAHMDMNSIPISGELLAYETDQENRPIPTLKPVKVNINLQAHNGENVWIEYETPTTLS